MTTHNPENERIKRRYFAYLKEAKRHSEPTVDAVAKSLARFEADIRHRDFKAFHFEQAIAFKKRLAEQKGQRSGEKLSKATLNATLAHVKRFFHWLAGQPGYKVASSVFRRGLFQPIGKGRARSDGQAGAGGADCEQVKHVIALMPAENAIQRRDRALDRVHAADWRAGQRHCLDEAETRQPRRRAASSRMPARSGPSSARPSPLSFSGGRGEFTESSRSGSRFCGRRCFGATTIRCFRRLALRWAILGSLRRWGWNGALEQRRAHPHHLSGAFASAA
jgi:hypothetical protein